MEKRDILTIVKNRFGFNQEQLKEFEKDMDDILAQMFNAYKPQPDGKSINMSAMMHQRVGKRFFISLFTVNFDEDKFELETEEVEEEFYNTSLEKIKQNAD